MSSLERWGWNGFFEQQIQQYERDEAGGGLAWARVVEEQRGLYRIDGGAEGWAEVSGRFRHESSSAADFPAVGDWVGVAASASTSIIHVRLERREHRLARGSRPRRRRAGHRRQRGHNLSGDRVDAGLNPRRLERYLTMVWDAGAVPVVVLNKADLSEDPGAACAAIRARLPHVDVVSVSALADDGLAALLPYLQPARTVALLGMSGVGKSTLVNRLARRRSPGRRGGSRVGWARTSHDDVAAAGRAAGRRAPHRHAGDARAAARGPTKRRSSRRSTTSRRSRGGCRFEDCAHGSEPGCAVMRGGRERTAGGGSPRELSTSAAGSGVRGAQT